MQDFSNFLFVTDLDGSFFGRGARLVPENLRAVEEFKAAGGLFTASTGRIPYGLEAAIPNPSDIFNAPAIMSNGACIYDFESRKYIRERTIDCDLATELIRFARELDGSIGMRISTTDGTLTSPDWINEYVLRDKPSLIFPISEWGSLCRSWYKLVFRGEADALLSVKKALISKYGNSFEFTTSSPHFLEVMTPGCSKADGLLFLRELCEKRYGRKFTVMAMGDYENDLLMLRAADISGCPENALDAVKAVCRLRLCECDAGAAADMIRQVKELMNKGQM